VVNSQGGSRSRFGFVLEDDGGEESSRGVAGMDVHGRMLYGQTVTDVRDARLGAGTNVMLQSTPISHSNCPPPAAAAVAGPRYPSGLAYRV